MRLLPALSEKGAVGLRCAGPRPEAAMAGEADPTPAGGDPQAGEPGSAKGRAFLRLFLQNERRLYAYILTLLPHRADADDVLQEASLVMWDKFDDANPPADFTAWGCRIAYFK